MVHSNAETEMCKAARAFFEFPTLEANGKPDKLNGLSFPEEDIPFLANQSLQYQINTASINSLVLRTPVFKATKKYGIVLLVISAEWEKEDRQEIRRNWASVTESKMQMKGDSLVIFLVARSSHLEEEASTHGDLLQINFDEAYRNLVYKVEAGFRWLSENVRSDIVAKIDSDTVVHIDRLYKLLRSSSSLSEASGHWFVCHTIQNSPVIRDINSPWYVSERDYVPNVYSRYCSGAAYVMKRATFETIIARMGSHKVIEVEDAFLTGIVAKDLLHVVYFYGVSTAQYTEYSKCDRYGPYLSILNTINSENHII